MIFDKSLRNGVYRDLVQLKKLFGDVAKNGSSSTYTITKEDQKAITSLYSAARETVPESLKNSLMKQLKKSILQTQPAAKYQRFSQKPV